MGAFLVYDIIQLMNINEFFSKYIGVGVDTDGAYGFQCMDLMHQYCMDVLGLDKSTLGASSAYEVYTYFNNLDGKDNFDLISNSPVAVPQLGDIVVWSTGIGSNGHIAVCVASNVNEFASFDQNWPIGSLPTFVNHNFANVLGWLRPHNQANIVGNPAPVPSKPAEITGTTVIPLNAPYNQQTVDSINSLLSDHDRDLTNANTKINNLTNDFINDETAIQRLTKQLADCNNSKVSTNVGNPAISTDDPDNIPASSTTIPTPNGTTTTWTSSATNPPSTVTITGKLPQLLHSVFGVLYAVFSV